MPELLRVMVDADMLFAGSATAPLDSASLEVVAPGVLVQRDRGRIAASARTQRSGGGGI